MGARIAVVAHGKTKPTIKPSAESAALPYDQTSEATLRGSCPVTYKAAPAEAILTVLDDPDLSPEQRHLLEDLASATDNPTLLWALSGKLTDTLANKLFEALNFYDGKTDPEEVPSFREYRALLNGAQEIYRLSGLADRFLGSVKIPHYQTVFQSGRSLLTKAEKKNVDAVVAGFRAGKPDWKKVSLLMLALIEKSKDNAYQTAQTIPGSMLKVEGFRRKMVLEAMVKYLLAVLKWKHPDIFSDRPQMINHPEVMNDYYKLGHHLTVLLQAQEANDDVSGDAMACLLPQLLDSVKAVANWHHALPENSPMRLNLEGYVQTVLIFAGKLQLTHAEQATLQSVRQIVTATDAHGKQLTLAEMYSSGMRSISPEQLPTEVKNILVQTGFWPVVQKVPKLVLVGKFPGNEYLRAEDVAAFTLPGLGIVYLPVLNAAGTKVPIQRLLSNLVHESAHAEWDADLRGSRADERLLTSTPHERNAYLIQARFDAAYLRNNSQLTETELSILRDELMTAAMAVLKSNEIMGYPAEDLSVRFDLPSRSTDLSTHAFNLGWSWEDRIPLISEPSWAGVRDLVLGVLKQNVLLRSVTVGKTTYLEHGATLQGQGWKRLDAVQFQSVSAFLGYLVHEGNTATEISALFPDAFRKVPVNEILTPYNVGTGNGLLQSLGKPTEDAGLMKLDPVEFSNVLSAFYVRRYWPYVQRLFNLPQ